MLCLGDQEMFRCVANKIEGDVQMNNLVPGHLQPVNGWNQTGLLVGVVCGGYHTAYHLQSPVFTSKVLSNVL